MIRKILQILALLSLTGSSQAEVVLSNNTSTTTSNINLSAASFSILFTPNSIRNYEKFFLNVNNQFGGSDLTQVKLTINGGSEIVWNGTVSNGNSSQLIDFDISSLGQSSLSATTLAFAITAFTGGNSSQTAINTAGTQTVTGAWNNSYTNSSAVKFELSAVPEPSTLLLGGIAAACGGTSVWWKRRKRQQQPESTEQPAII
jgi:hypothetical protein